MSIEGGEIEPQFLNDNQVEREIQLLELARAEIRQEMNTLSPS